jgi:hypothetical protein
MLQRNLRPRTFWFSNRRHKRKRFFSAWALSTFFLCFGAFFCSAAPQAFFRPDRRFRTPSRAEAVKVGRRSAMEAHSDVSRPRLDSFEHGGRQDDHGPESARLSSLIPLLFAD